MQTQINSSVKDVDIFSRLKITSKKLRHGLLAVSTLAILSACTTETKPKTDVVKDDTLTATNANKDIYVAFAGGGWRAHTGHTAWMVGLLDNDPDTPPIAAQHMSLDEAFTNVSAISSNSGGSWFNVMLSYSDSFRAGLEKPAAATKYLTDPSAYYINEKTLFNTLSGESLSLLCSVDNEFSNLLAIACMTDLNWDNLIEDIVFGPLSMSNDLAGTSLNGKQAWTDRKTISLAATALTGDVVLGENGFLSGHEKFYYDAPDLGALNIVPVTFGSAAEANVTAPKFFSGGTGSFTLSYGKTGDIITQEEPNNLRGVYADSINVIHAAAGSSAAIGFLSSDTINAKNAAALKLPSGVIWDASYEADDLSVFVNLPDPNGASKAVTRAASPRADINHNAKNRIIKIADGGALDNSGVAHSVMLHQANYRSSVPFEIVAFDNVQKTYSYAPTRVGNSATPVALTQDIGIDLAFLFGYGYTPIAGTNGQDSGMCMEDYCVTTQTNTVSQQIFNSAGLNAPTLWRWASTQTGTSQPCELIYTPYAVQTVANDMMGIKGGYSGTLHSFTANCPSAETAPLKAGHWAAYEDMYAAIQTGLQAENSKGVNYLRTAFKLPTP
ncbi:hypothetical protein GCM10011309_17330 [Litorimonas cladophorae]|uniref:Uncharacterized protein n=1 Tax=Litorimonas cladophorae TaxID=1220491 RepID=A0A918NG60_9PROT|nr:hypothetical protein [Litorimonas cladophorae]GGX68110.1 hypothetical protein GCM10011309_17330 [Litorimonas cladophorae]